MHFLKPENFPTFAGPRFQNYQTEVKEFYGSFNNTLPWLRDSEPTPQAVAIIRALQRAETKGLRPEDYDGPKWDERIETLQQARPAPEPDLVRFDVALTVSTMRYVSDLHIGRVNPRLFHFGLDIDRKEFDLSEFLRLELVDAKDVNAVLETVEPPFPAYHRTIDALNRYLELARQDDGEPLPSPAKVIKPGDSYAGVARLARRLRLVGDLPPQDKASWYWRNLPRQPRRCGETFSGAPRTGFERSNRRADLQAAEHAASPARGSTPAHVRALAVVAPPI